METKSQLRSANARLKRQVSRLRSANKLLARKVSEMQASRRHVRTSTGSRGEKFIAKLLGGNLTPSGSGHDLVLNLGKSKHRFEIKTSECYATCKGRDRDVETRRWTFHRLLGTSGNNQYDFLLLMGDIDTRHRRRYNDKGKPLARYVMFLVPKARVQKFACESKGRIFQITTNPETHRASLLKWIWDYQITRKELIKKFSGKRGPG